MPTENQITNKPKRIEDHNQPRDPKQQGEQHTLVLTRQQTPHREASTFHTRAVVYRDGSQIGPGPLVGRVYCLPTYLYDGGIRDTRWEGSICYANK